MNTLKLVDELVRAVNSGYNSSDKKVDDNYIFEMLPQWRAQMMILTYNGGKVIGSNTVIKGNSIIPPNWLQEKKYTNLTKVYKTDGVTVKYLKVDSSPIISLNSQRDGMSYIGASDEPYGFFTTRSLGEVQSLIDLNISKKKPVVLVTDNERRIYGNPLLKEFTEISIFQDPYFAVPTFNYNTDRFPIAEENIYLMKEIAIAALRTEFRAIKDVTADNGNLEQAVVKNSILG